MGQNNIGGGKDGLRVYINHLYIGYYNHTLIGQSDSYHKRPELFVPTQNRTDLGVSYKLTRYNLTTAFNLNNVFDKELYDHFSVPKPGRSFNVRIIYEINNF
ncbi:MAG: TonB-dependent receptor [Leadbetterella sp.]|nr:TonB-dependent receptor [Leadbetterella sp.]